MNRPRLEGRRVLVTGGAGGIGRAICRRLIDEGACVFMVDRREQEEIERYCRDLGESAAAYSVDVTDEAQVESLVEALGESGGVTTFVHAVSPPLVERRFRKASWDEFVTHWDAGVGGAVKVGQALLRQGKAAGFESMVFVLSSVTRGAPPIMSSHYVTAKYGLLGLARALAVELASKKVRVNCLSPGFVRTPLTAGVDERIVSLIEQGVPLGRLCTPEDVAAVTAFLVSSDASHLTGLNIPVAGGAVL